MLSNSSFPELPEAQNPLREKLSGSLRAPESSSNGGFLASGNFGKDEFLRLVDHFGIQVFQNVFKRIRYFLKFLATKIVVEIDFSISDCFGPFRIASKSALEERPVNAKRTNDFLISL